LKKILIVDDDASLARTLELHFRRKRYSAIVSGTGEQALKLWRAEEPDLVLLDVQLPDMDGSEVLSNARRERLSGEVLIITAHHNNKTAIKAIRQGAADYLYKPLSMGALDLLLEKTLNQKGKTRSPAGPRHIIPEAYEPDQITGRSPKTLEVIKAIARVSETRTSVLIEGETGTGKELVARTIHQQSSPGEPFIAINCANVVGNLVESELFGHEKGAFTGATQRKSGKLEYARGGTVLLDEVGELPLDFQAKFLRVLQEHEFEMVGGTRTIRLHARILAATNRNLEDMVRVGSFREDLYYRLKVFTIRVEPLRERPEDIVPLTEYFVNRFNREMHRKITGIPLQHIEALKAFHWPGNVRELQNVLHRGCILSRGETLDLDVNWLQSGGRRAEWSVDGTTPGEDSLQSLAEVEKTHILKILMYTRWHYGEACRILGISRPTLRKKISELDIPT